MYLTLEGNTSISEAKRYLNGKANSIKDRNIDGFQVIVSDKNGNFSEYIIRKKRLIESPFSGEAGLSPSFSLNIKDSNSNVKKTGGTMSLLG